ncbi:Acetate kinase [Candidatus Profftia lariciata]|uniref:acetate kinase n=1 Tax=Candidatus Profftia lariciata TaxID=1987921 RepID=UPI001D032432|nr:acetate kinase [Candidatus Profftia lariciata]UDG81381.1 Acetate kinase [Candidatus Profftia lariciata]
MSNLVLVFNCGSSSLKFAIIDAINSEEHLSGLAESLNLPQAKITWKIKGITYEEHLINGSSHKEVLYFIVHIILSQNTQLSSSIIAIGHRIVHGGENFTKSTLITNHVLQGIKNAIPFAPLHNPVHIIGIMESFKFFPKLQNKNVAVFDTSFHSTMTESSYLYAIPYNLYKNYGIRRYGAHGISHFFVSKEAAKILNKPLEKLNAITCHLGSGASITAVRNGQCVDTSMGMTPLEGLVMNTRSGDIDPSIIFYLYDSLGMSINKIKNLLTQESGLLGLTGVTSDCRYIADNYFVKNHAKRAMDIFCHRLAKYIGGYTSLMDGKLDAVVFTGGIGENVAIVRTLTLNKLSLLGFQIDDQRNLSTCYGKSGIITTNNSSVALVIPTNEELIIAQDTLNVINI